MRDGDQARAGCHEIRDGFENGTLCLRADIGDTNDNAESITQLVKRRKQADMLVAGRYNLVTLMPMKAVTDDVEAFAGVVGQGDLAGVSVQETGSAAACVVVNLSHRFKCCRP